MSQAETTLCTAIEAGPLEQQVLLLAESLRRFGGRQASTPLVAVRPRRGAPIATTTRRKLDKFGVTLVEKNLSIEFAWWDHANKPAVLGFVEEHARTPNISWVDGDIMILREPASFAPPKGYDFVARTGEASDVASNGNDGRQLFWELLCEKLGLKFSDFSVVQAFPDEKPIRAYWQSGVMTYRRDIRFADTFRMIMEMLLSGDIASTRAGVFHTDQVSVALAVQKLGLRAAQYDPRMNFNVNPLDRPNALKVPLSEVYLMHYHGSLWPQDYEWMRGLASGLAPDRVELLDGYAPLQRIDLFRSAWRTLFRSSRARKVAAYEARVVRY